jgi:hypothetical protein
MARRSDSEILALLDDPDIRPSLIAMLVVGVGLGYAIKILIDQFRKPPTP